MTETLPTAIFLVNLVQDVNVLRPLAVMARRDFGLSVRFLVADKFAARDLSGIWQNELDQLASETHAEVAVFDSEFDALAHLAGHGVIFAGSESNLHGHAATHNIFRIAPASYLRVTLQHGFECVGFRHSAAHQLAHGPSSSFAADYVCAWYGHEHLNATSASQRAKVIVTGPGAVLQQFRHPIERDPQAPGLVCENLHSVRLNATGDMKAEFVDVFAAFCARIDNGDRKADVALRPHPGGQYMLRQNVPLPPNVRIENAPIYRVDLRQFAYGISAPSSVVLDMVLAGIPTAVWRDRDGRMDTDNYAGLPGVSSVEDWIAFARRASAEPESFVDGQRAFLERFGMPLEPDEVHARFARLFATVVRQTAQLAQCRLHRAAVTVQPRPSTATGSG